MPLSTQHAQALLQKIQSLPEERIAEIEDFVDFLKKRTAIRKTALRHKEALNFPVDDLGPWPEGLTLSREEMYDNKGR